MKPVHLKQYQSYFSFIIICGGLYATVHVGNSAENNFLGVGSFFLPWDPGTELGDHSCAASTFTKQAISLDQ